MCGSRLLKGEESKENMEIRWTFLAQERVREVPEGRERVRKGFGPLGLIFFNRREEHPGPSLGSAAE